MAALPRNKCFIISLLKITTKTHLIFVWNAPFNFKQKLFIPLDSHNNLAMNIFDVHVFSSIASMSAHQRRFVSCIWINIIRCCGSCCVLQGGRDCIVVVLRCLLDWVDRAVILVHWCRLRKILWLLHRKHLLSIIKALDLFICNFCDCFRCRFVRVLVLRVCSWVFARCN